MPRILIVAYGNPLRCDDGVAWLAADKLENTFPESEVEILRLHQLAPEVAEAVRHRNLVVFLDAALDDTNNGQPGQIRVKELSPDPSEKDPVGPFSHVYSPIKILEISRQLYQASPKAYVITVTGGNFDHGDRPSDAVAAAIPSVVTKVAEVVRGQLSNP